MNIPPLQELWVAPWAVLSEPLRARSWSPRRSEATNIYKHNHCFPASANLRQEVKLASPTKQYSDSAYAEFWVAQLARFVTGLVQLVDPASSSSLLLLMFDHCPEALSTCCAHPCHIVY